MYVFLGWSSEQWKLVGVDPARLGAAMCQDQAAFDEMLDFQDTWYQNHTHAPGRSPLALANVEGAPLI